MAIEYFPQKKYEHADGRAILSDKGRMSAGWRLSEDMSATIFAVDFTATAAPNSDTK